MEVGMSLNALVRVPVSSSWRFHHHDDASVTVRHSLFSSRKRSYKVGQQRHVFVVEAKGKKGMAARQFQRNAPPPLPKIEDDGNPKFVIFIRMANVFIIQLTIPLLLFLTPQINSLNYSRYTFGTLLV